MTETEDRGLVVARNIVGEDLASLPDPHSIEWEEAKEIYRGGAAIEQASWLVMGYAASCVEISYGEHSLETFAHEVDASANTVYRQRAVYRRIMGLEESHRSKFLEGVRNGHLSYSHLLIANPIKDDNKYIEVLDKAHDNDWSKRRFAEEVATERGLDPAPPQDPDGDPADATYDGAEEVVATRKPCPHCEGSGEVWELPV